MDISTLIESCHIWLNKYQEPKIVSKFKRNVLDLSPIEDKIFFQHVMNGKDKMWLGAFCFCQEEGIFCHENIRLIDRYFTHPTMFYCTKSLLL